MVKFEEKNKINFEEIDAKVNNILKQPINGESVKLEVKERINNILERLIKYELKRLKWQKNGM